MNDEGEVAQLMALCTAGRYREAEASARQLLQRWPNHAAAWRGLGWALAVQQRFEEALPLLQKGATLFPGDPEVHNNLGAALRSLGRFPEAEASYRRALQLAPEFFAAHNNLGNILKELGRLPEAEACFRRALEIKPTYHEAHSNLANVLQDLGRFAESEASCRRALEIEPADFGAHLNLGNALKALGRPAEAEASYRRALEIDPNHYMAHGNLGALLPDLGRLTETEEHCRRALELRPDYHAANNNQANALMSLGRFAEAERHFHRALELKPDCGITFGNLLFMLNYHPERSAEEIFSTYRQFEARFGGPLRTAWHAHANDRTPSRRLRVGYVSPDFRKHSCRYFIEPLFAHHDRAQVEVFAYSDVRVDDAITARLKSHATRWVRTVGLTDAQMAEQIRADRIDILVDLAGHTRHNRLLVFARKPAPVSVSTLGFGYTTGLKAIDWYLTDGRVVPQGAERLFSERLWRLANCVVYRPAEGMGEVSPLPAARHGRLTFATLTRAVRVNRHVVRVWSEILRSVPGSRLLIDSSDFRDPGLRRTFVGLFSSHGVDESRLEMGYHSPPWNLLRETDITLDCFPHNSGTTLFESLYMGVPFITLAGRPSVGRLGTSILSGLGHEEWIAANEREYVDTAVRLAGDLPRLAEARAGLRGEMEASAWMNGPQYAHDVEAAYREMWQRWCGGTADSS